MNIRRGIAISVAWTAAVGLFAAAPERAESQGQAAGFAHWYDKYSVDDFALGQETLSSLAQPSFLMLGYLYRPYTAHTVIARLTYIW